jgi:hypothetical protein
MRYRVYDTEKKCWVKDNVYLNPDGELFTIKKSFFGRTEKPTLLSSDRYVYHNDIELCDKNGNLIYIGDYIKAQVEEDRSVIGLVAYAQDPSVYTILCEGIDECFVLGSGVCQLIEIIGNVFDGYEGEE